MRSSKIPEQHLDGNNRAVCALIEAASILQIPEPEIFHCAHQQHFNSRLSQQAFESLFRDYIYHARIPPWVLDFCQQVQYKQQSGQLNRTQFGVSRTPAANFLQKCTASAVLFGFAIIIILLIKWAITVSVNQSLSCVLPPCY